MKTTANNETMKHFVFEMANGEYELFYSTSMKQAMKDVDGELVAVFKHHQDAENFVHERNNIWR